MSSYFKEFKEFLKVDLLLKKKEKKLRVTGFLRENMIQAVSSR